MKTIATIYVSDEFQFSQSNSITKLIIKADRM